MSDYPLISNCLSEDDVRKRFADLCRYRSVPVTLVGEQPYRIKGLRVDKTILRFRNKPLILDVGTDVYNRYNIITDFFTESARIRARRFDAPLTALEYWVKNGKQIQQRKPHLDRRGLNDYVYSKVRTVSNFKPTIALAIMQGFKPVKILDPCAGWGDRLLAAMAYSQSAHYLGFDPNPRLVAGHQAMIQKLGDPARHKVCPVSFDPDKVEGEWDMVLTSTPFYDVEIYNETDPHQSTSHQDGKKRTETEWFAEFLIPLLAGAWSKLRVGGVLIISINNVWDADRNSYRFQSVETMIRVLSGWQDANYLGCLPYGDVAKDRKSAASLQPIWIWSKTAL